MNLFDVPGLVVISATLAVQRRRIRRWTCNGDEFDVADALLVEVIAQGGHRRELMGRHGATSEAVIRGEILKANGAAFALIEGEALHWFRPPEHEAVKPAVGHRVVVRGRHAVGRKFFHATSVEVDPVNARDERMAWHAQWKASGGPARRAPLCRWSHALVIGTTAAIADLQWCFKDRDSPRPFCRHVPATAKAVLSSLHQAAARRPDVIVLIRGGGDGVHMYEDLELLKAIARVQESTPVVVGIGHANQNTLVDDVALSFGTPSYAAQHLLQLTDDEEAEWRHRDAAARADEARCELEHAKLEAATVKRKLAAEVASVADVKGNLALLENELRQRQQQSKSAEQEATRKLVSVESAAQLRLKSLEERTKQEAEHTIMKWQLTAMCALLVGAAIGALFGGLLI